MTRPAPSALSDSTIRSASVYRRLRQDVVDAGLCTHCGTCAGLSQGTLTMAPTANGPLPAPRGSIPVLLPESAYASCPGKGIDYPDLCRRVFGAEPENWLIGCIQRLFIGYATDPIVRRNAASGGILTQTLLYLRDQEQIDGAVVVRQGQPHPWSAQAVIARSADEIRAAAQSVYAPVPVNLVLEEMAEFDGTLAYVGLPDQVASLRRLQALGHPGATKVRYVLGPYVGTNMVFGAIESFLRANGINRLEDVAELRYRDGEWPGHLLIRTRAGRELRAEKFYYNYLIPFYLTRSTLYAVDFTNELTDISVGDAWHPRYETQGGGFSVVVARTPAGAELLAAMQDAGAVHLEPVGLTEALAMHGHMLDFKKRGSFIRMGWRAALGRPVPHYGYHPATIPVSRKLTEIVIAAIFTICGTAWARRVVEHVPIGILGPLFDQLRIMWKSLSKPSKRRGLLEMTFVVEPDSRIARPSGLLSVVATLVAKTTTETATISPSSAPGNPLSPAEILRRTRAEIGHWLRRDWTFGDVGAHWDATEDYDDINEETYSYFRRFVDGLRLSHLPDQLRVLDLCARTGNGTLYFHQHNKINTAVCADVSPKMGEICRRRLQEGDVKDFVWLQIFDYALPLPDDEFDAVLCFETVEHVAQPQKLVQELARVVKPDGILILTTPNILWEPVHALAAILGLHHSEGPHRFLRDRNLRAMVRDASFVVEAAETTVLVPGGPDWLVRAGEWIEERTRHSLMPWLGLRRVLVCRKR